jgi:hypothetical protein
MVGIVISVAKDVMMTLLINISKEVLAIAPRTEALETPILDPTKERHENSYYSYNDWKIEVDNTRTNDIG